LALVSIAALRTMAAHAAVGAPPTILVVGDSLSAEYGLARGSGWVALLEQRLQREHINATVVNASISGDTTAGGLARLPSLLRERKPTLVVIELGANDALRGLPLETTRANLAAMAHLAKSAGAKVLIIGMQLPPNYGRTYGERFASLFAEVARAEGAALVPFMLKGVADVPEAESMFQADRLHPLASAHPTILANVWPVLAPLLK
jgi:acyl-CoA thioesterase-1